MTTGNVGPSVATVNSSNFIGVDYHRDWSGTDGKWETYAGGKRLHWNNYHCQIASRRRNKNKADVWHWGATPTAAKHLQVPNIAVDTGPGFFSEPSLSAADDLRLLNKLLEKVKGHDFNLAVNLSQMNQVSSMVASNLSQFGRAVMSLKRGDFANAARCLGVHARPSRLKPSDVAGRWLELQYGWLPTLSDTFEAMKAFHEISEGPRSTLFRTSVKKESFVEASGTPSRFSQKYLCTVRKQIQYEMYEEMTANRSLGLADPLSVVWENIPYSFVVDWFVPIGSYLDALNGIPNLKGRFLTTTTRRRRGFSAFQPIIFPFTPNGIYAWLNGPTDDSYHYTVSDRVYSLDLEVPRPSFKLNGAVHGTRVWNAISLASQRFLQQPGKSPVLRPRGPRIHLFRGSKLI